MKLPKLDLPTTQKSCKKVNFLRLWLSSRRALSLQHDSSHDFALCQWQKSTRPSPIYLVYRWTLFLAVVAAAIASFCNQRLPPGYTGPVKTVNHWKWFIYFTNWGYILILVQTGVAVLVQHRYRRTEKKLSILKIEEEDRPFETRSRLPLLQRIYWVLFTISTDLAFVITVIYWSIVYNPKIHPLTITNILVHGVNSIMMVTELLITSHPFPGAHVVYSVAAGLLYCTVNIIYWVAGGTNLLGNSAIYESLDWTKPGKALGFVAMCVVALSVSHALSMLLVFIRTRIANYMQGRPSSTNKMTPVSE